MSTLASSLRIEVKRILDELQAQGKLSLVLNRAFKHFPLNDPNLTSFPAAIIQASYFESVELDTATNERTYTFDIVIVMKGDDISGVSDVEQLQEDIANAFDNEFTLDGKAIGGVSPAVSRTETDEFNGKQLVMFTVTIEPKVCYTITS